MRAVAPLLLAVAVPMAVAVPASATVQARAAERLVALLASDAIVGQIATRLFDGYVADDANLPPARKAQFAANPGMKEAVAGTLRGEIASILHGELPTLRQRLVGVVSTDLSEQEAADTLAFFATPTGQKVVSRMVQGVSTSGARNEAEARQAAMTAMMASLGPDDYGPLLAFAGTSAAKKLQALNPKISATSTQWAQDVVAKHQPRLLERVDALSRDYLAKKKQG